MRSPRRVRAVLLLVLLAALAPGRAAAQVRPDLPWQTLTTRHFRVHFTPELEPLARRAATEAEAIYERLARELHPPRGLIELIVTDHADFANGSATPWPSNRVVIHARPPIDDDGLRAHADWTYTLLVHELTHSFQLDRAGGAWRVVQTVFGRAAPFFPQTYAPSWLLEGIAVVNESRLAPGGRLGSTEFSAGIRALALDSVLPPLDGVSLARPFYPGAPGAYLIGAEMVTAALARSAANDDARALARLIGAMGTRLIPWRHDANARAAFGAGFTQIHAAWRDSLSRAPTATAPRNVAGVAAVGPGDVVATPGWTARHPRYRPDGALTWVGDDARQVAGLFVRNADGAVSRERRRNSIDASAPLDAHRAVYAELDFTGLYTLHSDLWLEDGSSRRRLTRGARLSAADVDPVRGRIVAVRTLPGATELVQLSLDDPTPSTLAAGSFDRTWADPRYSRSGALIAAALWERGGRASIVVLDAATGEERARFSPRARTAPRTGAGPRVGVVSHPAWIGDTIVVFTSDHDGAPAVYRGDARTGAYGPLWMSATALHTPDVSPDGAWIAAVELRGDGFRLVERRLPDAPPMQSWPEDAELLPPFPDFAPHTAPASAYSAKSSAGPTWWLPSSTPSDIGEPSLGFFTGGLDVVGRHQWSAGLSRDLNRPETSGHVTYAYAGFGNPVIVLNWQRLWQHAGLYDNADQLVGYLAERTSFYSGSVVHVRPRVRFTTYAVGSAQVEQLRYQTYPSIFLAQLETNGFNPRTWRPALAATLGVTTLQRPVLAVSAQDGVSATLTAITRPGDEVDDGDAHELRAIVSAAKSLPLPGFARPVLAARAAVGIADDEARRELEVGGVSGQSVELVPGTLTGGSRLDYFIRGIPEGAQRGTRAVAMSGELRVPLARVGRAIRFVPLGLRSVNVAVFTDAGAAWCAKSVAGSPMCEGPVVARELLATAGAELQLDAILHYDVVYRFRLGIARAVRGNAFVGQGPRFYFTLGDTF